MGSLQTVQIPFELCAESLEAAQAAQRGGAGRIELCVNLAIGGITPPEALTAQVLAALDIPVHLLIRPRGGNFVYSPAEFALMAQQVLSAKAAGAHGLALGVLLPSGRVDIPRTRELIQLARPMSVTFHRAFDETPNLPEALEAVIATGADSLLTSGGAPDVLTGADQLAALVHLSRGRIQIMAGGGLKLATLTQLITRTGVDWVHGSLTRRLPAEHNSAAGTLVANLESDVRQLVSLLQAAATRG